MNATLETEPVRKDAPRKTDAQPSNWKWTATAE
jgi:hypothetical protein